MAAVFDTPFDNGWLHGPYAHPCWNLYAPSTMGAQAHLIRHSRSEAMHDEIQKRAYALWEADGRPEGQDQNYWFKAMSEIAAEAAKSIKPPRKRAPRARKAA